MEIMSHHSLALGYLRETEERTHKRPFFLPYLIYLKFCIEFCFTFVIFFFLFFFFVFSKAIPTAYRHSQVGVYQSCSRQLCHSHSNAGSELHLRPIPQLAATLDLYPTDQGQGSNPQPHAS